jgi:GNAT superfamily N-acetyltransferase
MCSWRSTVGSVPVASLGFRTDLMLLTLGGSSITERDGLTVLATPSTPDFWWGNFVLAPDAGSVEAAVALHAEAFPEADFVSIGVDGTDGAPGIEAPAAAQGLTVERITVLSSATVGLPPHPNTDAEVRRLRSDEEFEAAADLQHTNSPASGRDHVARRFTTWRRLMDEGHGAWFGAFLDGRLCASLGLFTDGNGIARYQAVDTHPDHRRRGLAGTLVHDAGSEGLTWPGVHTLVILADPGDDAIRVYRSVGFDGTETQVQLVHEPPDDAEELTESP